MRIGILNVQVPFITGGAERHSASLCNAFRERGFDATEITVPFKWYPARTLVDHVLSAKLLDLGEANGNRIDLAVGLKFPAYLARHPNKVFWILHQHRQAYDMWDSGQSDLLHDPEGVAVRALIHEEDRRALTARDTRVYANSRTVSDRLSRFLDLPSTPLYHPPPLATEMRQGAFGDYLFAPSRMNDAKRQMLMLEALAQSRGNARIVFAGPADSPAYERKLHDHARDLGIEDRVTWLGSIDDETMIRCYAEARGVVFIPVDEDYGYITLEAMLSGKPVITTIDAGGPLEFIEDGEQGFVVQPEARALGAAFDRLMDDPALAQQLGEAGLARYEAMDIGWDSVVATLTDGTAQTGDPLGVDPAALLRVTGPAQRPAKDTPPPPPAPETAAPAPVDLDSLKQAIAPSLPDDPPFSSVSDLLDAYDFGTYTPPEPLATEELVAYFETHWRRYLATLSLAMEGRIERVLDVGTFPPFLFQAMLAARGCTRMDGVWERPQPFAQTVRSRREGMPDFDVSLASANVERDPLPFETATFDLVLGMEILEHLAIDPLFFLTEAARVLRPGGRVILTTPNITSHRGMREMLDGNAPYSSGIFVPTGGVYGRHNREYAPHEVLHLAEAAGFETETFRTVDVYDDHIDPEVAALLSGRGPFGMRGETILYAGRRNALRPACRPQSLYHGDPRQMSGRIHLADRHPATGVARLTVENRSPVQWYSEGEGAVELFLEWRDARGSLVHDRGHITLPVPLAPGDRTDLTLTLDPGPPDASRGTVGVELYLTGIGRMAEAGRANLLSLPCSEEAFLRIVRGSR